MPTLQAPASQSRNATRSLRLDLLIWTSSVLAVGCALLAVGHLGFHVPLLSALGPGGSRAVLPAVIAFSLAALLHGAVSAGVHRRHTWAWPLGVFVAAVTLLGAAMPFRGVLSAVGSALAALQLALLLTRDVRSRILSSATS
jgi:hypothetical protein